MSKLVWATHERACALGQRMYTDPVTGFEVFTESGLRARGRCCGSGCRHCPYRHERIPFEQRALRIQRPALLAGRLETGVSYTALPWRNTAAGHDIAPASHRRLVLVCPFSAFDRTVADGVKVAALVEVAAAHAMPLLGLPLPAGRSLGEVMRDALRDFPLVDILRGDLTAPEWRELQAVNLPLVAERNQQ